MAARRWPCWRRSAPRGPAQPRWFRRRRARPGPCVVRGRPRPRLRRCRMLRHARDFVVQAFALGAELSHVAEHDDTPPARAVRGRVRAQHVDGRAGRWPVWRCRRREYFDRAAASAAKPLHAPSAEVEPAAGPSRSAISASVMPKRRATAMVARALQALCAPGDAGARSGICR